MKTLLLSFCFLFAINSVVNSATFTLLSNDDDCIPQTLYRDQDGDGHGDPAVTVFECVPFPGYVTTADDCNDNYASVNPVAIEICNGIDDNCSGEADENVSSSVMLDWQKSFGGSADEELYAMTPAFNGGYLLAGSSKSSNGDVSSNRGGKDLWVVRIDHDGNLLWQETFGGADDDVAYSVKASENGYYFVAGSTSSSNGDVSGNHGFSDVWLIKLDSLGQLIWQRCFGGTSIETAYSMAVTRDGGCIFAGVSRSSNGNLTSNYGLGDYWVGKVDAGGNLEWQRNYGGTGNDFAHAIEQTGDGGYLVSGYARSADVDVHYNNGQEDMWILRLDETGTILWQKSFGGTGGEGAGALRITNDGGCVLAGTTHSFNIDVIGNHGYEHDFWVVKIDSLGKKEWARCLGGDDTDNGNEIIVTEDGGYLVVGRGESYNGDATSNKGSSDFWAVKLNASGAIQWQCSFGGTSYDEAYAVLETAGGHFVVGGFSSSADHDVTVNRGGSDFWVAEVVPPSTTRFYADEDGDGYGNSSVLIDACSAPAGFVSNSSDCNDANTMQHPEQEDICNGIDDDCNGFIDENGIQASITPLATLTICNTSILTYSANVGAGFTYQWMIDGLPITGATAATYDANTAGTYSVAVSDGTCSATSAGSILKTTAQTVDLLPSGTSTVCPGLSQNFKFTSNPGLTFQWYKSGIALPGITGSSYSTSDTGSYYVRISDIVGCSFNSSTSTLQNYAAPVTTLKVTGNLNICSTGSVKFTVTAQSGSTYKWYKDNQVISGATKNTYTATSADSYQALVTTSNGCSKYTAIKSVTGCRLQREIIGEEVETVLGVFPNPSNGTFTLKVESMHAPSGAARFYAFNAAGQMVLTQEVWLTDGRLEERITLPESTKPGLYFLRLITSEAEATSTIVITE